MSLSAGLGLCSAGAAVTISPRMPGVGLLLFWIAMLIPFAIFMIVLLAAQPSRALRELPLPLSVSTRPRYIAWLARLS